MWARSVSEGCTDASLGDSATYQWCMFFKKLFVVFFLPSVNFLWSALAKIPSCNGPSKFGTYIRCPATVALLQQWQDEMGLISYCDSYMMYDMLYTSIGPTPIWQFLTYIIGSYISFEIWFSHTSSGFRTRLWPTWTTYDISSAANGRPPCVGCWREEIVKTQNRKKKKKNIMCK